MSPVKLRAVLYDPEPEGRQHIAQVIRQEAPEIRLTLRANIQSFQRSLELHQFEVVILGFPMPEILLSELLSVLIGERGVAPLVFLVGDGIPVALLERFPCFTKGRTGLSNMASKIAILQRAKTIDSIQPGGGETGPAESCVRSHRRAPDKRARGTWVGEHVHQHRPHKWAMGGSSSDLPPGSHRPDGIASTGGKGRSHCRSTP